MKIGIGIGIVAFVGSVLIGSAALADGPAAPGAGISGGSTAAALRGGAIPAVSQAPVVAASWSRVPAPAVVTVASSGLTAYEARALRGGDWPLATELAVADAAPLR